MAGIFLSYRREDSAGHTGRIYDRLVDRFDKQRVFRDLDTIKYGDDFVEAIEQAIGSCEAFVVVIGRGWLQAKDKRGRRRIDNSHDYTRVEVVSALNRDVPVIPVLVGGAMMPGTDELPDELTALTRHNALEVTDKRFEYDVVQLIQTLEKLLGEQPRGSTRIPPAFDMSVASEFPASVRHQVGGFPEKEQLAFVDEYRQKKKTLGMSYLLLFLPAPPLGLHNCYLRRLGRQFLFWCALAGAFAVGAAAQQGDQQGMIMVSLVLSLIWPILDLLLLPGMVRRCNEKIALTLVTKYALELGQAQTE